MARSQLVGWLLWTVAIGFIGSTLTGLALLAFVFSIGTASVSLDITATVVARETKQPVAGCLLTFEQHAGLRFGVTSVTTDAQGRVRHTVKDSYGGSMLSFVDREIELEAMLYLGQPPREDTSDEVETWFIYLKFDEPRFTSQVAADVRLERVVSFHTILIDGQLRPGGTRPLPHEPGAIVSPVNLRIDEDREGFVIYRVPLTLSLSAQQLNACQKPAV
jgi:hypothetical protein